MSAKEKTWAVKAAEEIDAFCATAYPCQADRLIRIARLVAIIDEHRPRDIGQAELEAALKKLDLLEQRTEAALREAEQLRAVRAVYPHGV